MWPAETRVKQATMLRRIFQILGVVALAGGFSSTLAQELAAPELPEAPPLVSELRVGIFAHKVTYGFLPFDPNRWIGLGRIEDLNVELLFTAPDNEFFRWMGSPRPNLGATFSMGGLESMAHLALTWQVPVFDTPFFIEGTLGAAVHNGALSGARPPRTNFGCRAGFYESASLGMNVSDNATVMITYEHTSNLGLCTPNGGLSNLGVRMGYKF